MGVRTHEHADVGGERRQGHQQHDRSCETTNIRISYAPDITLASISGVRLPTAQDGDRLLGCGQLQG